MTAAADPVRVRLAQIGERAEKATAGPWSAADEHGLIPGAMPAWCISRMLPGFEGMTEQGGYLYDVAEIVHDDAQSSADAEFIAAARQDVPALLAAVNAVLDLTAKARHGATRWADPLPVPEWVDRVELAVAAALRVTE